jgi:hypothetical protein
MNHLQERPEDKSQDYAKFVAWQQMARENAERYLGPIDKDLITVATEVYPSILPASLDPICESKDCWENMSKAYGAFLVLGILPILHRFEDPDYVWFGIVLQMQDGAYYRTQALSPINTHQLWATFDVPAAIVECIKYPECGARLPGLLQRVLRGASLHVSEDTVWKILTFAERIWMGFWSDLEDSPYWRLFREVLGSGPRDYVPEVWRKDYEELRRAVSVTLDYFADAVAKSGYKPEPTLAEHNLGSLEMGDVCEYLGIEAPVNLHLYQLLQSVLNIVFLAGWEHYRRRLKIEDPQFGRGWRIWSLGLLGEEPGEAWEEQQ